MPVEIPLNFPYRAAAWKFSLPLLELQTWVFLPLSTFHSHNMAELVGNVLVGQSGGPTSVINASVAGVVAEALNHSDIEEIYGSLNGVLGILQEDIVDLAAESQQVIRG